ncbi:MAG: thioredoxin [Bacteroidota bacterium]
MKKNTGSKILLIFYMLISVMVSAFVSCGGRNTQETDNLTSNNDSVHDSSALIKNDLPGKPDTSVQISESKKEIPNEILHLNDNNFEEKISNGVVLVDFWATWCKPCLMQAPILEEVNREMGGKVTIAKLDIDKNKVTTNRYGVMNIPTMLLFNNGKQVNQFVGLTKKEILIKAINNEL